ncbi:MAG: hypothetical protein JO033_08750 [Acidobacteriaceae bacterium]|nr:hypothetical protein [Acidobacteriaceae bacterium]
MPGHPYPHVVDLGASDVFGEFASGLVSARWCYCRTSAQRHILEDDGRVLFLEGQPDRLPEKGEPIEKWLDGRSGSFRGFEIADDAVRIFVDPLGTRPVFLFERAGDWCAADKLATISANEVDAEVNWPALLEACAIGSIYAAEDTTLTHTRRLEPGEFVEIDLRTSATRKRRFALRLQDLHAAVQTDPAGTLLGCLTSAVQETWKDPGTWLLMSGGLDSRFTLALADTGRKAITLDYFPEETSIAVKIAEACSTGEFRLHQLPTLHYVNMVREASLITGGMLDANFINQKGFGIEWRSFGISSVAHAFLFDTILKAWFVRHQSEVPPARLAGAPVTGAAALVLQAMGRGSSLTIGDLSQALTPDGAEALNKRLKDLCQSMGSVVEDGFEIGFERRLISDICRQVHFGFMLGWYEEGDIVSPIFHPSIWSWYSASRPTHRHQGKAIREALLKLGHPVSRIPAISTMGAVTEAKPSLRDRVRRNSIYRNFIRPIRTHLQRSYTPLHITSSRWLRNREGLETIVEGIHFLEGNPLINVEVGLEYVKRFAAGDDDRYFVPAVALMNAGRWSRHVTKARKSPQLERPDRSQQVRRQSA